MASFFDPESVQMGLHPPGEISRMELHLSVIQSAVKKFSYYRHPKNPGVHDKKSAVIETIDGCPVRTLYIANLPLSARETDVLSIFGKFGHIMKVEIVNNQSLEKKAAFGFVTYRSPSEATRVLRLKRKDFVINGQRLYISMADSWHQPIQYPDGTVFWDRKSQKNAESHLTEDDHTLEEETPAQDNDKCPILKLNDDCLLIIFSYIPLHERPIVGAVCRRWRDITGVMWSTVRELDFSKPPLGDITLNLALLRCLVEKCDNLTTLNLCQNGHRLTSTAIAIIAKMCRKLELLSLQNIDLQNRSLALLARSCPNLKSFAMEGCLNCHDGEIISLIKKCPKLERIALKFSMSLTGAWLKHLTEPLNSLSLNACEFKPEHLRLGINNVKRTLKNLSLVSCFTIQCSDLDMIAKTVPGLTAIKIAGGYLQTQNSDFKTHTLSHISKLKSLVVLDLERNTVLCDDFIQDLLDNCPHITTINLSCTETSLLTQKGISLVAKFPKLSHLLLAYLSKLTDSTLKAIAQRASNLKRLDLIGCISITDDGCSSIVSLCHSLEYLDISGCHLVTNATVTAAIESVKMDSKRKKLMIVTGGSGVSLEPNWSSPDIDIERSSNCFLNIHESDEQIFFFDIMDDDGGWDVIAHQNAIEMGDFHDFDALDILGPYNEYDYDTEFSDESFELF